jgi:hypothetical protein
LGLVVGAVDGVREEGEWRKVGFLEGYTGESLFLSVFVIVTML